MSKADQVLAGYHLYGYWVEASVKGGHVVNREDYGNSPYDSTSVFPVKEGGTVSLEKLRKCAASSANALAEELGVKPQKVGVFHDTDCEENIREELNDIEVAA